MSRSLKQNLLLTACGVSAVWCAIAHADDRVEFNRDVRPILSDKCFFCHGPDNSRREADLRLDDRDAAVQAGAFVPGRPHDSEILNRITSGNPDVRMPPESAKLGRLSDHDIDVLRRWIAQGAEYEGHWAFLSLPESSLANAPTVLETSKKIDSAVRNYLEKRGLHMQPQADRHVLIRRLSFDLTGLPPTPEEVERFVTDESESAVEDLVNRLLGSVHYGERMAVDWLDISRYADSFGFQVDRDREMWPWRDWVIRAFNDNMPFSQFLTWQLAGDLLPNSGQEQVLATAFNRLHQQESEGGSVEEEYRVEYVCDRVQTFATAFLGLTIECARCHDHKYDPITQKEYYQLFAMFQNIDEAGLYSFFTPSQPTPAMSLTDPASGEKLVALQQKITELEGRMSAVRESCRLRFSEWLESSERTSAGMTFPELARFSFDTAENGKLANSISPDSPAALQGENVLVRGRTGQAVRFTGDDAVELPLGNFSRHDPFSISLWLKTPDTKDRAVVFHRSRAWTDAASRGYELLIEDGRLKWSLIHFWPGNAVSVLATDRLPVGEWVHVTVTSDGSSRAGGLGMFVGGHPAQVEIIRDALTRQIRGGGGDNITLGERFRDRGFRGGLIDDFRVFSGQLCELQALAVFDEEAALKGLQRSTNDLERHERELLFEYFLTHDQEWQSYLQQLKEAREVQGTFHDGLREIMVMRELPEPKKAWVLFRGEYDQRREEVTAGTPAALLPFPDDAPRNRLGLAQWLTDPRHPLTARVTVNRVWQSFFGRGLVRTSEDFGSQGSRPEYPEILDTLAVQLISNGWDMKNLIRSIVLSDTYQQAGIADAVTMADDPDNEWLARGPRLRLSAEMIRDNALVASGLLNPAVGGPPVHPYEMTESFKPSAVSAGDAVYRRSLYTHWRRTGPPPAMLAFDAPRRAVCTAKRERTDSPLQALILLNGVQYVEAARVLGETIHEASRGDLTEMIQDGAMRCLSRKADERERQILTELYREQLSYFQSDPEAAESLLAIGTRPRTPGIPAAEAAAATILAQALLNHDECVVKR